MPLSSSPLVSDARCVMRVFRGEGGSSPARRLHPAFGGRVRLTSVRPERIDLTGDYLVTYIEPAGRFIQHPRKERRMLTLEEVAKQSREERFERLERAADTFAAGVNGRSDAELGRRPDA